MMKVRYEIWRDFKFIFECVVLKSYNWQSRHERLGDLVIKDAIFLRHHNAII